MGKGLQRNHCCTIATTRAMQLRIVLCTLLERRHPPSTSSRSAVILHCVKRFASEKSELVRYLNLPDRISIFCFGFNFESFNRYRLLVSFQIPKTGCAWNDECNSMALYTSLSESLQLRPASY